MNIKEMRKALDTIDMAAYKIYWENRDESFCELLVDFTYHVSLLTGTLFPKLEAAAKEKEKED